MSDILNEYYKIAVEKGLIKKEAQQTRDEKWADKEYREKIQALYGLDINNTDKSIIEEAHPNMLIIAPSYDKVNGLVENEEQRHDIMVGLVNKSPVPNTPTRKIAEKELLDALISIGFALDSEDQDALRDKADECSIELVKQVEAKTAPKQIKKEAIAFLAVLPYILYSVGAIAAIGVIKSQLVGFISQGPMADTERLISELNDILDKVGPQNRQIIKEWIDALNWFHGESNKIKSLLSKQSTVEIKDISSIDKVGLEKASKYTKEEFEEIKKYTKLTETVSNNLHRLRAALNSMQEQSDSSESEWWSALKGAWHSFVGSDLDDAKNATDALISSLKKYIASLPAVVEQAKETAEQHKNSIKEQLQQQTSQSPKETQVSYDAPLNPNSTEEGL